MVGQETEAIKIAVKIYSSKSNFIQLKLTPGDSQIADALTKPLGPLDNRRRTIYLQGESWVVLPLLLLFCHCSYAISRMPL